MRKRIIYTFLLLFGCLAYGQECTKVNFPSDGSTNNPVDVTITWPEVSGINGYLISLGTTPNGTELLSRESTGINNFYTAPTGLPDDTLIYVTISVLLFNTTPTACDYSSFRTMDVTSTPSCTRLSAPDDNASNVTVVTDIIWQYASTATSYNVSIGTSEGGSDLLDNFNVGNVLSYDPPNDFPQDVRIYVRVRPENENGTSPICTEESFFTGHVDDPCEVKDEQTGEVNSLAPEIEFPTLFVKCKNSRAIMVNAKGDADGYRWYRIEDGKEILISENKNYQISQSGNYLLETFNSVMRSGISIECYSTNSFNIIESEPAIIKSIDVKNLFVGKQVTVNVSGIGDYEYAIDNENGPYQKDSVFTNVPKGSHIIYIRDKNGCGISSKLIERDLKPEDFPPFFTPNGDNINDYWQFIQPPEIADIRDVIQGSISIFDRYGSLLYELDPLSRGWDGNFNGKPLPSSDYWFKAIAYNQQVVNGHFTLKR